MKTLSLVSDPSWQPFFHKEAALLEAIDTKLSHLSTTVYPPKEDIFKAFELTSLSQVKVVILGQDPYHGEGEAQGLSFSVAQGCKIPPSLRNIFKELHSDLGITRLSTDLSDWAQQGVLLINAILTVEKDKPGSHSTLGWEQFTDNLITYLSQQAQPIIFVLWGNYARKKRSLITAAHHHILEGVHPSPLAAYRGFWGSKPFSTINRSLGDMGKQPIEWGDQ